MRVTRVTAGNDELMKPDGRPWERLEAHDIDLIPSPVAMAATVSRPMAMRTDHGKIGRLQARMAHNGETLSVRLAWEDPDNDDRIADLDRFVDAAAVMFPLVADTNPFTMGEETKPVNAWLWKADQAEPFDVIARGYATSQRRPAATSGLAVSASYSDGAWAVVFQRPLRAASAEVAIFEPNGGAQIAFAVWEGSNAERAGQKAVSGAFIDLQLDG